MKRSFYSDSISNFLQTTSNQILGALAQANEFSLEITQRESWLQEIKILREVLSKYEGKIFFEYSIPRMGRRIDVVLIIRNVIFILEFKVGEKDFFQNKINKFWYYALDFKNFHEIIHIHIISSVLVAEDSNRFLLII